MVKGELGIVKRELGIVKRELGMVKGELGMVKGELGMVKGELRVLFSRLQFCIARKQESLPHAMICPLPQQLNWRLGSIHLPGWHVQIVNKYDTLFPKRWSKDTLPPFVQLGHNDVLSNIKKKTNEGKANHICV